MRKLRPQPKERRKVPIPEELRAAMGEAFEQIERSKGNDEFRVDYDDAIQALCLIGGKCGKKPRPFQLTYWPTGDKARGKWELELAECEIEDIGDGRMTEILLYCCTASDCRMKFRTPDATCFYCDYSDDPEL